MNRMIQLKTLHFSRHVALLCFGLLPRAQAVVPAPDGAIPTSTLPKGKTPFSASPPALNTAIGWFSLESTTTGSFNTAIGAGTLLQRCRKQYSYRRSRAFI